MVKPMSQAVLKVKHQMFGRVWFQVNGLQNNVRLAARLEARLVKLTGVTAVKADIQKGLLKLCYSKKQLIPRQEPEDLPVGKQLFNVALGGAALGLVGVKRCIVGPSALASSRHIFNLNAAAALISGYPILRSGFHSLTRGRINHDLIIGAVGLGTILLQESVPGLLVFWLANLATLGQSLVLRVSQRAIRGTYGDGVQKKAPKNTGLWNEQAAAYSDKVVPLTFGLSALTGLATGSFSRSLAMLLAANPAPTGFTANSTRSAVLSLAARHGVLIQHPHVVEDLSRVDVIVVSSKLLYDQAIKCLLTDRTQIILASSQNKMLHLTGLQGRGRVVTFISNDLAEAGLLKAADVGIWVGSEKLQSGQQVATDILITQVSDLPYLFRLAGLAENHFERNITAVQIANLLGLGLGATGWLSPVEATIYTNLTDAFSALRTLSLLKQW